ncbi:ATP-binding cassette domain-containing protein [bacterium]|nr:ATP-binding cassette domain-containing protein [bacterium]
MVEVSNLVKTYGDLVAVDHISFSVARGEIVGLLGPNGAGKSTTMKIITCFMPATAGAVTVAGLDVFTRSIDVRRHVGYMPENVPLYPEMRVSEYLRYRGRLKGLGGANLRNRIDAVVDACQIDDVYTRIIEQLSKGYRQRVGLAEAMIADPDLLILDEPTIGLDPNQVRQVRDLIKAIGKDRTVILSTHILPEVEMVCERVLIMHQGRLAFQDTMANLRSGAEKSFICEVKAEAEAVADAFKKIPGVRQVDVEAVDGWMRAAVKARHNDDDLREALFAAVKAHNWPLRDLHATAPTLEDVFVNVTTR